MVLIAESSRDGQSYNVGGNCERSNISVVRAICALIDEFSSDCIGPREGLSRSLQIGRAMTFDTPSMPGRSARSSDGSRRRRSKADCAKTVEWYLTNRKWWERIRSNVYRGERLGIDMKTFGAR